MYEDTNLMTAAELRFEAELDEQSAQERADERFLSDDYYSEDECPNCGEDCEGSCMEDDDDYYTGAEDAFIDAMSD